VLPGKSAPQCADDEEDAADAVLDDEDDEEEEEADDVTGTSHSFESTDNKILPNARRLSRSSCAFEASERGKVWAMDTCSYMHIRSKYERVTGREEEGEECTRW
jgi:hypothetical protein